MARPGRRRQGRPQEPQPLAPAVPFQNAGAPAEAEARVVQAQWIGPLPPPAVLRDYAAIVHDGAERVFRQFEDEGAHRRTQEDRNNRLRVRAIHIGQGLAGTFAAASFILTAYAIHEKAEWAAVVLGGSTLATGVSAFLGFVKKPRAGR